MSHTQNKYMMVLQYICGQPTFHSKNTIRQFKVTNNFLTAGKEIGLFKQVGKSEYKWNLSRPPLMSDVQDIQVRVRSYTQTHRLKTKPTPQLTIKPLTRVERIAPVRQPVQELEKQHTPYPIMDIVIAFLSGMIAAGFISLIWK
jgi:hypothetical protein